MTTELFKAEKDYLMAIYLVENLHRQGLLSDDEFEKTRKNLIDQYQPVVSSLVG